MSVFWDLYVLLLWAAGLDGAKFQCTSTHLPEASMFIVPEDGVK